MRSSSSANPVGHAGHLAVAAARALDLVDGRVDRLDERDVVLALDSAGDAVDLGLRVVDEVGDLALAGVAHLHDARAGLDEAAQHRLLGDDRRVVAGVGRGRDEPGERVQVLGAAAALQLPGLGELVGDGDDVGRLAVRVEREDRVEDDLVLRDVEVHAAHGLDDVGHRILAQEHAAEGALLGEQIVRRRALTRPGFGGRTRVAGQSQVGDRHGLPPGLTVRAGTDFAGEATRTTPGA